MMKSGSPSRRPLLACSPLGVVTEGAPLRAIPSARPLRCVRAKLEMGHSRRFGDVRVTALLPMVAV
jgi:hypothetical protein